MDTRSLLLLISVACAAAADKDLEAELSRLEETLQDNQRQIKALEAHARERRLLDPPVGSIFGASRTTRDYTWDENIQGALNHAWLLIMGALVMFMQAGFALLEAGVCRKKFVQNILLKNLTDVCVGTIGWWAFGWSFAYSGEKEWVDGTDMLKNRFLGYTEFFAHHFAISREDGQQEPTTKIAAWFFQWAFAGAAATIVSGGVAERVRFPGYCIFSFLLTSFVYPVVVAWTWGYGFLSNLLDVGYIDFAGSGIVHLSGGVGALVGAVIAGPREGRFKSARFSFEPPEEPGEVDEFAPHSQPLVVIGTLILWFGWYGFNCGSTLAMSDLETGMKAAHVAMTTTLSAATGGLTVFCVKYILLKKYDVGAFCNGILAGLVSITAGCSNIDSGCAVVVGMIGGILYQASSSILKLLKVDDPLDAFPVHGVCGIWGTFAAALFDWGHAFEEVHGWNGFKCITADNGQCKQGIGGDLVAANLVQIILVILWVGACTVIIFLPMKLAGFLVANKSEQDQGFDEVKHSPNKAYDYTQTARSQMDPTSSNNNNNNKVERKRSKDKQEAV